MEPKADIVFEIAFEVCNKVGGIYTVMQSKAAQMVNTYKDNYFAIGPYFPKKAALECLKQKPPSFMENVFSELKKQGIECYYGKWLVRKRPNIILIDYKDFLEEANKIKGALWKEYNIDSLGAKHDFNEPIVWSTAAGMLIEKLLQSLKDKKIVCHFHEWLSGAGLLYLRNKVPTIFTTHATILGRTIAGSGEDLYKEVNEGLEQGKTIESKRAYKYDIQAKHLLEKVAAENSNIFSTVSEITEKEAAYILGKRADIILPNGLDIEKFPTMEEFTLLHRKYKRKIKDFLNAYFNPYYETDLWDCTIWFTSGRYEFRNKGFDVFVEALGKLNKRMIENKIDKNVFVFFFIPKGGGLKENTELLGNIMLYKDIQEEINDEIPWIKESIITSLVKNKIPESETIFRKKFLEECKKRMITFRKKGSPPLSAFVVEENDPIIKTFKENKLLNREKDKVKVIFYPSYLSATDQLLSLGYEQAIQGSHLGVFPSYYEPWGYTPLDTAANGVLAITSDLAGFGIFIKEISDQSKKPGIMVLERERKKREEVVEKLHEMLWEIATMTRKVRVPKKAQAKDLASLADWKILIENYIRAHNMALERSKK